MFVRRGKSLGLGSTIKHLAPNTLSPQAYLQHLYLLSKNPIFTTNTEGNTQLHITVQNSSHPDEVDAFIKEVGTDAASAMAKMVNHYGEIPIDYTEGLRMDFDDKETIKSNLYHLMKKHHEKPLAEPINIDDVLEENYPHLNERLSTNLRIACEVGNQTLAQIKESETHPQTNHYRLNQVLELRARIEQIRNEYNAIKNIEHHGNSDENFQILGDIALKNGAGNCLEIGCAASNIARRHFPHIPNTLYSVANGDHVFLAIDVEDQYRFTSNTVIFDMNSGVYRAYDIPQKLKTYLAYTLDYTSYINILTSFNSAYHTLEPRTANAAKAHQLAPKHLVKFSSTKNKLGFFKSQNIVTSESITEHQEKLMREMPIPRI